MTSRERVDRALAHHTPDHVPLDLGASAVTGMHVSSVYALRQALGLDAPGTPVRVTEPYQMLGEIDDDLLDAIGADVVGLTPRNTLFGFANEGWKPWTTYDGVPVLVPAAFNTEPEPSGDLLMFPEGDRSCAPSGRMPAGGWYFDAIVRQPEIREDALNPDDNLEEFTPVSEADLEWFAAGADRLEATGRAILATFGGTAFGDIALVPAMWLRDPRGIRDVQEWYISTAARRDYVWTVFERQCEIGLANLARIHERVGDRPSAVFLTGTDFGTQTGCFISPRAYRDLYKPFHRQVNDWVHQNTGWRTFIHSCGAVKALIPDFIDAGFDVLNPVQCSAVGMEAEGLKASFGDRIAFWGGGVDTQQTLPFGTPDQVRAEVIDRIRTLGEGGGFVFNPIHNVQARTPAANLLALYDGVRVARSAGA